MTLELIRERRSDASGTPLLFLHGAFHGAWAWERWMPYLAERGFDCWAVSLRGHGNSSGSSRLATYGGYLADVREAISRIGVKPVLVGHSMGGHLAQTLIAKEAFPGAALVATVPHRGMPARLLARNALGHPFRMAAALATFDMKPFVRGARYVRETYFTNATPDVESLTPRLQGESVLAFSALGPLGTHPRPVPSRTPVLVIAGERDPNYPPALLETTARAWGGELAVIAGSGHEVMLDAAWREGAAALAGWAQRFTGRSASASAA